MPKGGFGKFETGSRGFQGGWNRSLGFFVVKVIVNVRTRSVQQF